MLATFRHGIHPPSHKTAAGSAIKRMAFAEELSVPLGQHIGSPARPLVREGEQVVRGQMIAEADSFVSACIHAPVTGTVSSIGWLPTPQGNRVRGIRIKSERGASQDQMAFEPHPILDSGEDWMRAVSRSGIVGLGGAAFPTHVKLKVPKGRQIDTLVVNGAECEPYLTADHRVMLEWTQDILNGAKRIATVIGAKKILVGIEANKFDAFQHLKESADGDVAIELVKVKYPQGAEKMLIHALLDRKVPAGGLPMDVGVVVSNVQTAAMIERLVVKGLGLVERVLTIAGDAVERPGNYLVPIGTTIRDALDFVGLKSTCDRVVLGGPMMGQAIADLSLPVTKGTGGILALSQSHHRSVQACIRCGHCIEVCPMSLNPALLGRLARVGAHKELAQNNLKDCFECGCCAFVCPSHIPLVQLYRQAKLNARKRAVVG